MLTGRHHRVAFEKARAFIEQLCAATLVFDLKAHRDDESDSDAEDEPSHVEQGDDNGEGTPSSSIEEPDMVEFMKKAKTLRTRARPRDIANMHKLRDCDHTAGVHTVMAVCNTIRRSLSGLIEEDQGTSRHHDFMPARLRRRTVLGWSEVPFSVCIYLSFCQS